MGLYFRVAHLANKTNSHYSNLRARVAVLLGLVPHCGHGRTHGEEGNAVIVKNEEK